jgi:hypothetical protein
MLTTEQRLEKKRKNKLKKLCVPKTFFDQFLNQYPQNQYSIIDKLRDVKPSARGRGESLVVYDITDEEFNDMYQLAVDARNKIRKAERTTMLPAAICAKDLSLRMEKLGVDNPVPYIPSKTRTIKPVFKLDDVDDDVDDIPDTPIVIDTVEVNEPSDEEMVRINQELNG